jgi:DNA-binding LytR/AlgR family response regulator
VRLSEILAITSAGNYVEFALQDGRRLLMRSPLSAVENDLEGRGFVRTHRSWLVNEAAVTGLQPEGSGDYGVTLGSLTVPLSRRFPASLARLRGGTSA